MDQITPEELLKQSTSLSQKLLEKNKNLGQEVRGVWSKISSRYYDFTQDTRDAKAVLALTKEDIKVFYDTFISSSAVGRRKMSVHMVSQKVNKGELEDLDVGVEYVKGRNTLVKEDELVAFKKRLELGNGALPILPISDYFDYRLIQTGKL